MRPSVCTLFLISTLFASCQMIPEAPAGVPRIELEVAVEVEPAFGAALADADAELLAAIQRTVLTQADIGLRFYAVASSEYAQGQARPDYLLRVRVEGLEVDVKDRTSEEGEVTASVQGVKAMVSAVLEKRRDNAPALVVASGGKSTKRRPGSSKASTMEASYTVAREGDGAAPAAITRDDVSAAVRASVRESLSQMIRAIDREFADQRVVPTRNYTP